MKLLIANSSNIPIYEQLETQLRHLILEEELSSEEKLPSIRSLARSLGISVITVKRAYDDLEAEGYLYTIGGKGSYVCGQTIERLKEKKLQLLEEELETTLQKMKDMGVKLSSINTTVSLLWEEGE